MVLLSSGASIGSSDSYHSGGDCTMLGTSARPQTPVTSSEAGQGRSAACHCGTVSSLL